MAIPVSELGLVGNALAGAKALKAKFPNVEFTSGRRDFKDQARAMASNVVHKRNFIIRTYSARPEAQILQDWVNGHPAANTTAKIATGLVNIMEGWSDAQRGKMSRHLSGHAFDVQPIPNGAAATAIKAAIRALPGLHKFLEKEAGLVRWHAQFN